jgi:hypothetical protein
VTLTAPPAEVSSATSAHALFEEARRRRRRRYRTAIASLVLVSGVIAGVVTTLSSSPSKPLAKHQGSLPRWSPPSGPDRTTPSVFVAADGQGGVGLYETATGRLTRTLSPEEVGGPDEQAVLSENRRLVYFVQPSGACSGVIRSVPTTGATEPTTVVSSPTALATEPSPSPNAADLAWIGASCESGSTVTSDLYVTDLKSGVVTELGAFQPTADNGMAWSPNGRQLAVENGQTIDLIAATPGSLSRSRSMTIGSGCRLTSPVFLLHAQQIAAIRTCSEANSTMETSTVLAYDTATGEPVAVIAAAPAGATFQGLSVDASRTHLLVGVVRPSSTARIVQVDHGRLVTVSTSSPTDAQW